MAILFLIVHGLVDYLSRGKYIDAIVYILIGAFLTTIFGQKNK